MTRKVGKYPKSEDLLWSNTINNQLNPSKAELFLKFVARKKQLTAISGIFK
jgi:hypothetical protein